MAGSFTYHHRTDLLLSFMAAYWTMWTCSDRIHAEVISELV